MWVLLSKKTTNFSLFITLILLVFLLNELFRNLLNFDRLIYSSISEKLTQEQIDNFISYKNKWHWFSYIIIAFLYLIKTVTISAIIYIGSFFCNKDLNYKILWNIVIKAEFIFLLVPVFKIIWFYFFQPNYDLNDIQNFYPLSALNIIGYQGLESWLIYPFQVLNVFELFYIIYLANQLGKATKTDTDYGLKIVSISYMPGLFLWITIVMFFTLNYT